MALEAPAESAPVALLFVKPPRRGRAPLGVPGAAQPGCLCGARGDSEKAGAGESRHLRFPARAGWPASQAGRRAWARGTPGARRQELPPGAWMRRDCGQNPPNIPKVFFFFSFSFPFPGALRERTGWGKWEGLRNGSFRVLFSSWTARKLSGPWVSLGPARLAVERIVPPPPPFGGLKVPESLI